MADTTSLNIPVNLQDKLVITKRFTNNLQKIMAYSLEAWGGKMSIDFFYEVVKEIQKLPFFPAINPKNRFMESTENTEYRNIILKKYPYVITYSIGKKSIRVINIVHKKRNPIHRTGK